MANVTVTVQGLDKLVALGEKYPAVSEKYINMAINRSLVRILGEEKQQAPVSTGNLRDNWRLDMGRFTGTLASNAPYAAAVHEGSAPHMPPVNALTAWAGKHGIDPWVLAKSIAKNGTKANPFLKRAVELQAQNINGEFQTALDSILRDLTV